MTVPKALECGRSSHGLPASPHTILVPSHEAFAEEILL
jgi:hypothetical protein